MPDSFIDKVDKAIVNFVWTNKTPKIKSLTMVSEIANAGMKRPNIQYMVRSQKTILVQRYCVKTVDGKTGLEAYDYTGG